MTIPDDDPAQQLLDKLAEIMAGQKWWQRYSNTVTASVAGVLQLVWWATAVGVKLPEEVSIGVAVLLVVGQVLGIKMTKNGITQRTYATVASDLNPYGRHARRGVRNGPDYGTGADDRMGWVPPELDR